MSKFRQHKSIRAAKQLDSRTEELKSLIFTHLGETGCEEHTLKQLPHLLKEFIHVRPFQHINLKHTTKI